MVVQCCHPRGSLPGSWYFTLLYYVIIVFTIIVIDFLSIKIEFINNDTILKNIDENWNNVIPHILDYYNTIPQKNINHVSELIRKEYMGDADLIKGNTENFIQVCIN